jgi:hypothetical protein
MADLPDILAHDVILDVILAFLLNALDAGLPSRGKWFDSSAAALSARMPTTSGWNLRGLQA